MSSRTVASTAFAFRALPTAVGAGRHPARAGGLGGGLLSPAIGNGCAAHSNASARGSAAAAPGTADGNHVGTPLGNTASFVRS
ncbi:hypothetical protein ACH4PU_02640 [Streptomyces sp. NPDC021100]|uniref:hypothetical protein n=1 Tax=Streptomyces sp. NPDC021100 TaxID=3365114 RepID=UPI0037A08166